METITLNGICFTIIALEQQQTAAMTKIRKTNEIFCESVAKVFFLMNKYFD